MAALEEAVGAIVEAVGRGGDRHRLLLFDFDGTLAEFEDNPDDVRLRPSRARLLAALAERPGVTVGIVSGREIGNVRRRAAIPGEVYYAGLHGLQIEGPDLHFLHPDAARARETLMALRDAIQTTVEPIPGVRIEDKTLGFTVHWRQADAAGGRAAHAAAEALIGPASQDGLVRVQPGFDHVDVIPNVDWNKGDAVSRIIDDVARRYGRPVWPLFIGDDLTDEHAFEAIGSDGVSVVVGARPSSAHHRLTDPEQVEELMRALQP